MEANQAPFADALLTLRGVRPEDLVKQINALFEQIARLDTQSVIAAWQSMDVFLLSAPEDSMQWEAMEKVQNACISRMVMICKKNSQVNSGVSTRDLQDAFLDVIGRIHKRRFDSF